MARDYVLMSDSDSDLYYEYARTKTSPSSKCPTPGREEHLDDNGASGAEKAV